MQMQRKQTRQGMGMVATMLVLLGILSMTLIGMVAGSGLRGYGGVAGMSDNAVQAGGARVRSAKALSMADSGVQMTLAWLSQQPAPPAATRAFAPALWGSTTLNGRATVTPDGGDTTSYFSVRIYPDSYNSDVFSATSTQKKYLIESVGVCGAVKTIVQVYVSQGSLSQYLVLLDSWNSSGNYWVSGLTTFDGPVHDNNSNGLAENIAWKSTANASPMFTYTGNDAYSVSGASGISWWKDSFNIGGAPQVITNPDGSKTNQWFNVAAGGSDTIRTGTPVVPFPTSSVIQQTAATGGITPIQPGVTLCPGHGIYINGDVSEMALSATGPNNTTQVITVTQGTSVQRITINPTLNMTTLETKQLNGSWLLTSAQSDTTNGVVYCSGNIGAQGSPRTGGVHGQVADNQLDGFGVPLHNNALTIATPQNKNCNVDGSLTYVTSRKVARDAGGSPMYIDINGSRTSDPSKGTPVYVSEDKDPTFTSQAGTLGLISKDVLVTKKDSAGADITNFEMDGTVLASGVYDADDYANRAVGLWENMGGYLSSTVGTFGVADGNTLQLLKGFNTQFNYDARMRNKPPPFFPTTGSQYNLISWKQVAQTLEP